MRQISAILVAAELVWTAAGLSASAQIAPAMADLPSEMQRPISRPGPDRGRGQMRADPANSQYFFRCGAAFAALAEQSKRAGGTMVVGTNAFTTPQLERAATVLSRLAELQAADGPRANAGRVASGQFVAERGRNPTALTRFAASCLAQSYEYAGAYERATRAADAASTSPR